MASLKKIVGIGITNILVVVLLLLLIEGMASYLFTAGEVVKRSPIPERVHTEYDETLGWINLRDVYIPDMYGKGVYLRTNAQRFRNEKEFSRAVPDGSARIICSGDSFTLGLGVDNDHTWCSLLSSLGEDLETVNMGQGGYGVDQAYLWYQRNGSELEHTAHIFAFITEDFWRMPRESFQGYGKPVLMLENGSLEIHNTPVPRASYRFPRMATYLPILKDLNSLKLLERLVRLAGVDSESENEPSAIDQTRAVVSGIFEDLHETNQSKESLLVLVFLPAEEDYMGVDDTEEWRRFVRAEAESQGIQFVDLVEEMRKLPPRQIRGLFGGHAHYSNVGNAFIAGALQAALADFPELQGTFKRNSTDAP